MNAIASETTILPQAGNWDAILSEVNAWRGGCMHHFSAVEMAVTETLLALSTVGGESIRLRHLIGQRLEDLTTATAPGGPFEEAGRAVQVELLRFRSNHEAFRSLLCHGVAKVAVERSGQWMLVLRALSIRGRQSERTTWVIDQEQALAILDALKRDGQKLASVLGQLRRAVPSWTNSPHPTPARSPAPLPSP